MASYPRIVRLSHPELCAIAIQAEALENQAARALGFTSIPPAGIARGKWMKRLKAAGATHAVAGPLLKQADTLRWRIASNMQAWILLCAGHSRWWRLTKDDLVAEGLIGAHKAAIRWQHDRAHFSTYSRPWIRVSMDRAEQDALGVGMPHHLASVMGRVKAVALAHPELSDDELAERTGVQPRHVADLRGLAVTSIETPLAGTDDRTLGDCLGGDNTELDQLLNEHDAEGLMAHLEPRARQALYAWLDPTTTLDAAGKDMGICRERVRQLAARALDTCRRRANTPQHRQEQT